MDYWNRIIESLLEGGLYEIHSFQWGETFTAILMTLAYSIDLYKISVREVDKIKMTQSGIMKALYATPA